MTRRLLLTGLVLLFCSFFLVQRAIAQLPSGNLLVGYHEYWNTLKLTQAHNNYNVICLSFALPVNYPNVGYDLRYPLPAGYSTVAQMTADIDVLHSQGKVVLLSIGGATGPIMLNSTSEQTTFENSIKNIFTTYGNKIDGIDMDLEMESMHFPNTWTMSAPAPAQTRMVNAIKNVMSWYQTNTGKKMLLTMAPEVVYLMGALSPWQIANAHGGAFLPILDGLRNELDLLHMQLYNAGGPGAGVYAWDGNIYYDDGNMNFALAMNESVIKGFTLLSGKGTFTGIPASKIAFGFPASTSSAGTGFVTNAKICDGVKYFRGQISKPGTVTYTMSASYPAMRGLMTWSINTDYANSWNFANGFSCSFPLPVQFANFNVKLQTQQAKLTWQTASEENADYFSIQKSADGISFEDIGRVNASGNSNMLLTYNYTDVSPNVGTTYYRIKEVDTDGAVTYSEIRTLFNQLFSVQVSPNPSGNIFTLQAAQNVRAVLQTITGNIIEEVVINSEEYSATFGETLSPGIYILSVQTGDQTEYFRLVKE